MCIRDSAKAAHDAGAELAFTYQGEALGKRVRPLAQELGGHVLGLSLIHI